MSTTKLKILVIDDEKECCDALGSFLEKINPGIETAYDGRQALKLCREKTFDLIITDVHMPDLDGIQLSRHLSSECPGTYVVLISGIAEVIESINAIDLGVFDFLTKPVDLEQIIRIIRTVNKNKKAKQRKTRCSPRDYLALPDSRKINLDELTFDSYIKKTNINIGEIGIYSDPMMTVYKKLHKLQQFTDIPVLLEGETGTGKEIIARYLHYESGLTDHAFVAINCATIDKELFSAELFGYEKGAYTGAIESGKDGLLKLAEGGTLFLDEITELPYAVQAKLLRVLQEKEYYRVGGRKKFRVATRILCSTNQDIQASVKAGYFRLDLYQRLNICMIKVPSLRERADDIVPLAVLFLRNFIRKYRKKITSIEAGALKSLVEYSWPGNTRELKNLMMNAAMFCDSVSLSTKKVRGLINERIGETVEQQYTAAGPSQLKERGAVYPAENILVPESFRLPEKKFDLSEFTRSIVKKTLERFKGNKTRAASFLGLTRFQFYKRYKDL